MFDLLAYTQNIIQGLAQQQPSQQPANQGLSTLVKSDTPPQQQQQQQQSGQLLIPNQLYSSSGSFLNPGAGPNQPVPKKKLSPFLIFVKHRKPILERERPDLNMKDILQVTSREWHALSLEEKQVYRDESERDKIMSDALMGIVTPVKPKKNFGVPGANSCYQVKKPLSPYMCFLREQRALLVAQHQGEIVMKEFVRIGAQKWTQMRDEEKERYRHLAEIDKMRYEREKQQQLHGFSMPPGMSEELQAAQQLHAQAVANQQQNGIQVAPTANVPQLQRQLQIVQGQIKQLEIQKPLQPPTALILFDRERRNEILANANCQTPKEAFDLILARFNDMTESQRQYFEEQAQSESIEYQMRMQHLLQQKIQIEQQLRGGQRKQQLTQGTVQMIHQLESVIENQQGLLQQQGKLIQSPKNHQLLKFQIIMLSTKLMLFLYYQNKLIPKNFKGSHWALGVFSTQ